MDDLLAVRPPKDRDPDGSRFRSLILAHYAHERLRTVRGALAQVVGFTGLLLGVSSLWPALLPAPVRRVALAFWAGGFFGMVAAWAAERRWRRKRDGFLRDIGGPLA